MAKCLLGLGSNLGDRIGYLTKALAALKTNPRVELRSVSSLIDTKPVGGPADQPNFLNAVAVVETSLAPAALLHFLLSLEDQLQRTRGERWGPRTIDLDLLLYDEAVIEEPHLHVPHPRMHDRRFVLEPAAEIAGDWRHPVLHKSIRELLADLPRDAEGATGFRLITSPSALQAKVAQLKGSGLRVGLVPTMGALHEGHLSLVRIARQRADVVVATIFVNPTQFGPRDDYGKYPRTLESDLAALAREGCDLVFVPQPEDIYPPGFSTYVEPPAVAAPLEGVCRPGHFRGVATVVLKLFNIAPADVACVGQKDFQQAHVIRRMVADLNLPIEVVVCPIVRDPDGLALSSRNRYLSPAERRQALALSQSLEEAERLVARGERESRAILAAMRNILARAGIERIDYVALADPDSLVEMPLVSGRVVALIACFVGTTRLIDNRVLAGEVGHIET